MSTETVERIIAGHPFFEGLQPRFFPILHEAAIVERFGPEQVIFNEGDDADRFYLVHQGHVALETFIPNRGMTTIQTIGSGDVLGWSWLFPPYRWHFTARSVDATEAVAFGARHLREQAGTNPEFGYQLAMRVGQVVLQRLQATRLQLLDFYANAG